MGSAIEAFRGIGAERIIDIGSSFNPLRGLFPHVTALDPVPEDPSVLTADFFEVSIVDGEHEVQRDPSRPDHCLAVPGGFYDGALLSLVLRSLRQVSDRREMIRRAASTLRLGGLLIVIEKNALASLIKYRGQSDTPWEDAGLQRRKTIAAPRGVLVNVFERTE